jgi:soluble P-type ATPase
VDSAQRKLKGDVMIEVAIPGYRTLSLEHLVLDYNGTLAVDGEPLAGVMNALKNLAQSLEVHVLTADTFGKVRSRLDTGKLDYVKALGVERTVCMGNGRNDRLMLKEAALGVAVILDEGVAVETLNSADVVCTGILSALELLTNPLRLTATLRS